MFVYLSKKASQFCVSNNIIQNEDAEVYEYGFEILLSTLINAVAIFVVSILTGNFVATLFFCIGFLPLRMTAGGYHAKTHLRCFLILMASYIAFLAVLYKLPQALYLIAVSISSAISFFLIFVFSPIEDINKPISDTERVKFKKKSRIIISVFIIVAFGLYYILSFETYALAFLLGVLTASLSLLASLIKNILYQVKNSH